jgi:serine/threonine protein kinase
MLARAPRDHAPMELEPGQIFQEVFEVQRKLGRGGMGTVYLATHRFLKRQVALKIPHPKLFEDHDTRQRLEREACLMARLHHEHIVAVYDMRWGKDFGFIALEYIEGLALRECLMHLPSQFTMLRDVLGLARQIAHAVDYLHQVGVMHRDLKPANILVELASGRAKLLDFGLARTIGPDTLGEFRTMFGTIVGTPGYMAPEQVIDNSAATPAADIYSFSVLLYKLLTGCFPWDGEGKKLLALQISAPPIPIHERNPALPKNLNNAFVNCFGGPKQRPSSAEEVYERVMEALGPDLPRQLYRRVVPQDLASRALAEFEPVERDTTQGFISAQDEETIKRALRQAFGEDISPVPDSPTIDTPVAEMGQLPLESIPDDLFLTEDAIHDAIDRLFS